MLLCICHYVRQLQCVFRRIDQTKYMFLYMYTPHIGVDSRCQEKIVFNSILSRALYSSTLATLSALRATPRNPTSWIEIA